MLVHNSLVNTHISSVYISLSVVLYHFVGKKLHSLCFLFYCHHRLEIKFLSLISLISYNWHKCDYNKIVKVFPNSVEVLNNVLKWKLVKFQGKILNKTEMALGIMKLKNTTSHLQGSELKFLQKIWTIWANSQQLLMFKN